MNHLPTSYPDGFATQTRSEKQLIAITATEAHLQPIAQNLAKQYNFSFIKNSKQEKFEFNLILTEQGLYLKQKKEKEWEKLKVDFLKGKIAYRLQHITDQKQLIAKAIGRKKNPHATVLDLTAGLGYDGFVLAQLGFAVTLLERSPIIAALLEDGLCRALKHPKYSHNKIQLIHIDATIFLKKIQQTKEFPNVIYLDPMYPYPRKSALVKKEMRLLRQFVGNDADADNLFLLALTCTRRIVVKRPRLAAFLAKLPPHHSIVGKQHRFDVYLLKSNSS